MKPSFRVDAQEASLSTLSLNLRAAPSMKGCIVSSRIRQLVLQFKHGKGWGKPAELSIYHPNAPSKLPLMRACGAHQSFHERGGPHETNKRAHPTQGGKVTEQITGGGEALRTKVDHSAGEMREDGRDARVRDFRDSFRRSSPISRR